MPTPPEPAPGTEASRSLAELAVGERGVVESVDGSDAIAARLADLGFVPGTLVTVRDRAPLGEPRIYELRNTRFCLRRVEAATIRVTPAP